MTDQEKEAIEILKQGIGWRQASRRTKLSADRLKTLWADYQKAELAKQAEQADGGQ